MLPSLTSVRSASPMARPQSGSAGQAMDRASMPSHSVTSFRPAACTGVGQGAKGSADRGVMKHAAVAHAAERAEAEMARGCQAGWGRDSQVGSVCMGVGACTQTRMQHAQHGSAAGASG